jgi:hypothetical protein
VALSGTAGTPPPELSVRILTRTQSYRPAAVLWSWKPPEPSARWQAKYDASVFVKSRVTVQ